MHANLLLLFEMDKENQKKLTSMGLVDYHRELQRKERVKLINYTAVLFGLSASVVKRRFNGGMKFTNAELIALQPVIDQELWRQ